MSDRQAFHRYLQSRGIPSELFQQDEAGAYEFATVQHDWEVWSAAKAGTSGASAEAPAAIERDESMDRDYIPLPGGWELQTKGKGSSMRLLDKKSTERYVLALPGFVVAFIERMAREVHAAAGGAK